MSTFNPPHDPYAFVPGDRDGHTYFDVFRLNASGPAILNTTYRPHPGRYGEVGEYPLHLQVDLFFFHGNFSGKIPFHGAYSHRNTNDSPSYTNVTNQPIFGCANSTCPLTCDNMVPFFHTNITAGLFQPVGISGSVSLAPAARSGVTFFPRGANFWDVKGVKLDVAFIENNYRDCNSLKGYQYMGV